MPIRTILSRAITDGTIETGDIKSTGLGSAAIEDQAITPAKISRVGGGAGFVLKINDSNTGVEFGEVTGVSNVLLEDGDNLLLDGTDNASANAGSKVQHNDVLDATAIGGSSIDGYTAQAWVNFNGTGTVAIRESQNISSITDNGTGNYTVNFLTNMSDANYCAVATPGNDTYTPLNVLATVSAFYTIGYRINTRNANTNVQNDRPVVCSVVLR